MQDKASAKKDEGLSQLVLETSSQESTAAQLILQKEADKLEKKLTALQSDAALVTRQLAEPGLYVNPNSPRLQALTQTQNQLLRQIEEIEARWMEVQELIEAEAN